MLFDLGPNYGGANEDNGDLLQKVPCMHCSTQCPQPCSRPYWCMPLPKTPGPSRASLGQSLVGSLLLSPGSWCIQDSVCALPESVFPVLYKFWQFCGGLMAISSKSIYAIPRSTAPRAPAPAAVHCWTCTSSGGTQTQFCLSLCRVSGPLSPLSISGGYGVWF